jgi:DNA-binding NtrC family response regulator
MFSPPLLFVDDDVISNLDICSYLRESGFNVIEAYSAPEAFQAIDNRAPLTALVSDVDLGPGASGLDVARHARAAQPELPVVFISGMADVRHLTKRIKGSILIQKPLHPRQIVDALHGGFTLAAA